MARQDRFYRETGPALPRIPDDFARDGQAWAEALLRSFERRERTNIRVYMASLNPASVAANSTAEESFSVPGLTTDDYVIAVKPSHTSGFGVVGARVSAADTLTLTFVNATGGASNPGAEDWAIIAIRPEFA